MLLTIKFSYLNVSNKHVKRLLEHIVYLAIVFTIIPILYYFELFIVLPAVIEKWTVTYFMHIFCANFIFLNIVGNLIFGMFTSSSIQGKILNHQENSDWTFCTACECFRPPRAWHCSICDICILKRDHHCTFLASCVGYYNQRYFIVLLFYAFIATIYALYYNIYFLSSFMKWNNGLILIELIFPLVSFVFDFNSHIIYIILMDILILLSFLTGFLFFYHFTNIVKGRIVYERNFMMNDSVYDRGWKLNIIEVFGVKWYLTWILPFINSPLPGNGIEWPDNDKNK